MRISGRFVGLSFLFTTLAFLAGCGSGGNTKSGVVKGSVKVDGVAANQGNVTFHIGSEKFSGSIDAEGNYRAVGLPPGEAKITVDAPHIPKTNAPVGAGMPGATSGPPVAIPAKYGKVETSNLSHTVTKGETTFDIVLTK